VRNTREAVLKSAIQNFARAGYDGVGVREIASDAGVTAMMVTSISGPKSSSDHLVTVLEAVFAAIIETPMA
jgi:hypothetical protein